MRRATIWLTSLALLIALGAAPRAKADTGADILVGVKLLIKYKEPIQKAIEPFLKTEVGKTQKVFPFAATKASRLIVSEQKMNVGVVHWHKNVFGTIQMDSTVPFNLLYSIDLHQVRCTYSPDTQTLYVVLPPTRIEASVTDHNKIERSFQVTGWRGLKTSATKLMFEKHLIPNSRGEANRLAQQKLPEIDKAARDSIRPFLLEIVRSINPDVRVQIEN